MGKIMQMKGHRRFRHKLTDEEIAEAARLLVAYEVATIPPEGKYEPEYSDAYTGYIHQLMAQSRAGTITPPNVPMGWQYYTRKGLAAILIATLLAGIAMPERVMAGYRWLVEVVEEFFDDRTEYRYTTDIDENVEFVPMTFGYIPEGMEEVNRTYDQNDLNILLCGKKDVRFIDILQRQTTVLDEITYGTNVEVYYTEILVLDDNIVLKLIEKDKKIHFILDYESYQISGQTNLLRIELLKILQNIEFK